MGRLSHAQIMQQAQQLTARSGIPRTNAETGRRLNEHETAEFLGLKVSTLRDWRIRRKGPPWLKICGAVRYDTRALEKYLAACEQASNAGGR
jgi:hypothetical protein